MGGKEPPEAATRRLISFAAAVAAGQEDAITAAAVALLTAPAPPSWMDELLLQSVLMVGYPRALVAAGIWRRVSGVGAPDGDPSAGETVADWEARGEATCRAVYGVNYRRLRDNVRALHPALDRWMVIEGYGRVLSRPGLDLARRELCAVAQIAVLGAPRQLHSHLRGARHAGASEEEIAAALAAAEPFHTDRTRAIAGGVWAEVRSGRGGGGDS